MPASGAADGEPRCGEEGGEQGAAAAGSAQWLLHFNMTEGRHLALLQRLMPAQQGVHHGSPGGLGNALTPEELEALHHHATRFRCESVRNPFSLAPDEPDAHEAVHKHITILMDKIIAAKWFLKDLVWVTSTSSQALIPSGVCGRARRRSSQPVG